MTYDDLTILIPVRIDSPDRLQNMHALIGSLKRFDGLRIILLEADSQPQIEQIEGVQRVFVEDHNPLFYRTRYVNMLCNMSRSEYIGV